MRRESTTYTTSKALHCLYWCKSTVHRNYSCDGTVDTLPHLNSTKLKKAIPVISSTVGVIRAAVPQPKYLKM